MPVWACDLKSEERKTEKGRGALSAFLKGPLLRGSGDGRPVSAELLPDRPTEPESTVQRRLLIRWVRGHKVIGE